MEGQRDDEIELLKAGIEELRRERRRLLGILATTRLDPDSLEKMEGRLLAVRAKLRSDLDRLPILRPHANDTVRSPLSWRMSLARL
jgi:hypothetical protein